MFAVSIHDTLLITHGRWEVIFLWWNKIFAVCYEQSLVFSSTLHSFLPFFLHSLFIDLIQQKLLIATVGLTLRTQFTKERLWLQMPGRLFRVYGGGQVRRGHIVMCQPWCVVTKRSMPPFRSWQDCLSSDEGLTSEWNVQQENCSAGGRANLTADE